MENHPDLYEKAIQYERIDPATDERYTWASGESLEELRRPERVAQIVTEHQKRQQRKPKVEPEQTLLQVFANESDSDEGCLICHL